MGLVKGGGNSYYGGGGGGGGGEFKRPGMDGNRVVAVAIDNVKGSYHAIKWAIENLLTRGQTVILIHVVHKPSPSASPAYYSSIRDMKQLDKQVQDLFISSLCFCTRKNIKCLVIRLEDTDVAKAISEYVSYAAIEYLVLGASSRHGIIRRSKIKDIPTTVTKSIPDFCTVYVISKGKISAAKTSLRHAPFTSPLQEKLHNLFCQDIYGSPHFGAKAYETSPIHDFSMSSFESGRTSCASSHDDSDAEMRRLKLELQKTRDLYSTACKEALTAKQKAEELQRWRVEEERRLEEAVRQAEREKAKLRAAMESPEATQRVAELEAQRRVSAEIWKRAHEEAIEEGSMDPESTERPAFREKLWKAIILEDKQPKGDRLPGFGPHGAGFFYMPLSSHTTQCFSSSSSQNVDQETFDARVQKEVQRQLEIDRQEREVSYRQLENKFEERLREEREVVQRQFEERMQQVMTTINLQQQQPTSGMPSSVGQYLDLDGGRCTSRRSGGSGSGRGH